LPNIFINGSLLCLVWLQPFRFVGVLPQGLEHSYIAAAFNSNVNTVIIRKNYL